jgi:hypothetical protein
MTDDEANGNNQLASQIMGVINENQLTSNKHLSIADRSHGV